MLCSLDIAEGEKSQEKPASTSKSKSKSKKKKEAEAPSHGDSEIHRCLLCPLEFRQEINLQQHVAWVHFGDRFHSCPHCGRRFFELAKLSRHMSSTHKTEQPVCCQVCKLKFNGKYLLECHTILEHPPSKSSRTINRSKNQKSKLIVEDKVIDRSRVEVKIGPACKKAKIDNTETDDNSKKFNVRVRKLSVDKLVNNVPMSTTSSTSDVKLSDPLCSDDEIVLEKELHLCPECDKPFTEREQLESHWRIHEGVTPLECSKCWKWFLHPEQLQNHLVTAHSN